jgi:hypothetical protein
VRLLTSKDRKDFLLTNSKGKNTESGRKTTQLHTTNQNELDAMRSTTTTILSTLALFALAIVPGEAFGQLSPVFEVENSDDEKVATVYDGGEFRLGVRGEEFSPTGPQPKLLYTGSSFVVGKGANIDSLEIGQIQIGTNFRTKVKDFYGMALGNDALVDARRGIAISNEEGNVFEGARGGIAIGEADVLGAKAVAINGRAEGNGAFATGDGSAEGRWSIAMGGRAKGKRSTSIGETTAASDYSVSIGKHNKSNTSEDGTAFVIGNGTDLNPSDAFVVDKSGNVEAS